MILENKLTDPIVQWLKDQYSQPYYNLLIHEEPSGKGGRRPDILVAQAPFENSTINNIEIILVEIENNSTMAIRDRKHGLNQLKKYQGHFKFLAVPNTIMRSQVSDKIKQKCQERGIGLLVVDIKNYETSCYIKSTYFESKTLIVYPKAWERWKALRKSNNNYRRISGRRIIEHQ
jgi:hypothetical protein